MRNTPIALKAAFTLSGALALAACQAEEPTYEADVVDESGGEYVVTPADAEGVEVELPETEMTPVLVEEADPDEPARAE